MKPLIILFLSAGALVHCRPQTATTFVSTTVPTTTSTEIAFDTHEDLFGVPEEVEDDNLTPVITEFKVRSDIQFRYSRTMVESYVKNPSKKAKEISFTMVMPKKAFVSNFSMTIKGEEFVAKVQGKEEAKETYDQAVGAGQSAGIVNQDVREANQIVVSTNVEPQGKVRFFLTYEELLQRSLGQYEQIIHVNPGQIVDDFVIDVYLNESLPISNLKVPELKTDPNAITSSSENPDALVEQDSDDPSVAHVQYKPSLELQKKESESGLAGQFMINYDVDRKNQTSDVQVVDGYFVHFFTPDKLETLPKHVIFVIDLSGSMSGKKLDQTKDAMVTIIDDLKEQDHFNILTFSDEVYHWNSENEKVLEGPHNLTYPGTEELRMEALRYVLGLQTIGGTNINSALLEGIKKAKEVKVAEILDEKVKPLIIFLTDGEATSGVTDSKEIIKNLNKANEFDIPVYGLAFGRGADFSLIKKVSEETNGLARKIYEGSDASIQLEDFYLEIASPLLSNVKFEYVGEAVQNVTKSSMGTYNKGGEFVIAGKIENPSADQPVQIEVSGSGAEGQFKRVIDICFRPRPLPIIDDVPAEGDSPVDTLPILPYPFPCFPVPRPEPEEPRSEVQNFIERLWAFTTINDLLKQSQEEEEKQNEIEDAKLNIIKKDEEESSEESSEEDESDEKKDEDKEEGDEKEKKEESGESEEKDEKKDEEGGEVVDELPLVSIDKPIVVKEETAKEKALRLALKYNFVTTITSLVVTRPKEGEGNDVDAPEAIPIDLVPAQTSSPFGSGSFSVNRAAVGGGFRLQNRFKTANTRRGPPGLLMGISGPHFSAPQVMMDFDTADYEFENEPSDRSPTTPKTSCSGNITLYDMTSFRAGKGGPVEITDDVSDLASLDFADKLASFEVQGDCCWEIYEEKDFQGFNQQFTAGKYNAANVRHLFRNANSVKKLLQC